MENRRNSTELRRCRHENPVIFPTSCSRQTEMEFSRYPRLAGRPTLCVAGNRPPARHPAWLQPATLALLLVVGSIVQRPATCATVEDQEAAHFRAGQEALRQGDLAQATKEFKKVLDLDPSLFQARVNLGLVYHALGEYSLAASNLSVALRQSPDLPGPAVILGIDYLKLGEPEKAIPVLQRALHLEPSNLEGRRALARCYLARAEFRQTADEYRNLASLNPDKAEAWYKLGHDYLDLSARLAFRGSRLYSGSAWGHRFLGDILFQRNRWRDAAEEYLQALAVEPGEPGLHVSLGKAYLQAGKPDQAEAEFHQDLRRDARSEPAWVGLAETRLAKGQATAALEAVGKAWEVSPEFLALARGFPMVDLSPDAAKALLGDLEAAPDGAPRDFLLAGLCTPAGETAQADERWKALQTDFLAWQKARGGAAGGGPDRNPCHAHQYADCAHWLESRKPLSRSDLLLLGTTRYTLQQYGDAAEILAKLLLVTDKVSAEASYWLALTYQALGAECYDRLEESFPESWRTLELRAEGYNLRDDANDALQEYQLALRMRPDEAELHEARGDLLLKKKSYDEAQAELEKSLRLDPSRPRTLCLLGRLYVQEHETEKAVPYLQKALSYEPDMPDANILLGTAYVRLGEDAKAIPTLEKAISLDFYGDVHYQMYVAYRKLGKLELADKALARSQELRRDSAAEHQAMVSGVEKVE
ncbi:MAG: tetratricopeptide repeat protein [Terriglobia bacterium]